MELIGAMTLLPPALNLNGMDMESESICLVLNIVNKKVSLTA